MNKRYQIFISSTFDDLENERGKVMETILNANCFPAGMELFPAMDIKLFEYIKRIIDDSDYYLLIIGGRYGSVDKRSGKSWTEQEFDYAVSRGIPVMVFDHEDFTKLPANKTDQDDEKRKKLLEFKEKVAKGRLINKWSNADNLALKVSNSLRQTFDMLPRIGWVRANTIANGDSQTEINLLKKEINDLKNSQKKNHRGDDNSNHATQEIIKNLQAEIEKLKSPNQDPLHHPQIIKELKKEFEVKGVSFSMVFVEGGTFKMGANKGDKDAFIDEEPAHKVTLSDYWLGETQVTQALWKAVMGENPSKNKNPENPVETVSWIDCKLFIRQLNKLTGMHFRLPTEAEWEFAARGGNQSKGYRYAGSKDIYDVAWFKANAKELTQPVAELDPNELGLYDMSGNVWEWCQDWYDSYNDDGQINPDGPDDGSFRVARGGCVFNNTRFCRVSCRLEDHKPTVVAPGVGLRLAL